MGPQLTFRFCDPEKKKNLSNLHKKHKKKSSQKFCQKTTNFVQQKLLMGPQKGRTSTNYKPMGRVSTFEHTSLLDLFLGFIPEPIPRVPAWYPPDAGMLGSSDNPPTYSGTMKRE